MAVQLAPREQVDLLIPFFIDRQAWTNWTPTITQSGNVTFTNNYAKYLVVGPVVILSCDLLITGSGTSGNTIVIGGLPDAPNSTTFNVGTATILDNGTAWYTCSVVHESGSLKFYGYSVATFMGVSPAFGLAANDRISFTVIYQR